MKRNISVFSIFSFVLAITFSCKDDVVVAPVSNLYFDYYPIDTGYWIEYSVDSIVHLDNDDILLIDTSKSIYHFFIQENIDSSFIDGEGQKAMVVSRYKRDADTLPWVFSTLWTSKVTNSSLQRIEDNRRYVRLSFPFSPIAKWNGNAYNELAAEEYSYEEIYSPAIYSTLTFDSTVTVDQNIFYSNINRIVKKEVYANHVGLIYKILDSVGVANTTNGQIILSGLEYRQTVINYKH